MKLSRICKSGGSVAQGQCPAVYVTEDPTLMVSQGKRLDSQTSAELLDVADDESAVAIPTETVLRAAGLFLASHGRPAVQAEVEAFLRSQRTRIEV